MNSKIRLLPSLAALLALPLSALAAPVATAFTYQGRLDYNGAPATGNFDLKFELYTEQTGGTLAVPALQTSRVVSGGLISEDLNFGGATVFDGRALWLEISARAVGAPTFFVMPGRTAVRPTPYAIHALQAGSVKDGGVTNISLAAGAVTSAKLATGAVGISQLNVGAPTQLNSVLAYNGSGLRWLLPQDVGQWGPSFANDGIVYSGKVGIGTNTPTHALTIASTAPSWTSNGWIGAMALPNASAIAWGNNAAGQRFGVGHTNGGFAMFRTASDPATTGSAATIDFFVTDAGDVGIGTTTPQARLDITGQNALRVAGFQPTMTLMDTSSNTSTRIQSVSGEINFFPGSYLGGNPATYVKINNSGNVSMTSCTIRGGADLAEPFAMSHDGVEPGTVVVIDAANPGKLKRSTCAYDKKVAGIVSGANGIKPGISMIQEDMLEAGENVALSGRVFVKADTSAGSIEPGDLLTTSSTAGRAMKAADPAQAQGAILGKAMTPLADGDGMVLVLVTLQ